MNNAVEKWLFGFPKVVSTVYRWGGQLYKLLVSNFLRFYTPEIIKIGYFLRELFEKYKGGHFLGHSVYCLVVAFCHLFLINTLIDSCGKNRLAVQKYAETLSLKWVNRFAYFITTFALIFARTSLQNDKWAISFCIGQVWLHLNLLLTVTWSLWDTFLVYHDSDQSSSYSSSLLTFAKWVRFHVILCCSCYSCLYMLAFSLFSCTVILWLQLLSKVGHIFMEHDVVVHLVGHYTLTRQLPLIVSRI